ATAAGDLAGSFDVNQVLALELSQTEGLPLDSTAYKNNPASSTAETVPASLIAGGVKFNGGQTITVPASASLRLLPNQGFTAAAWVRIDSAQKQAAVVALADQGRELVLGIDGLRAFARYAGSGSPVTVAQNGSELSSGDWHHLALTVGSGQLMLYVDGVAAGQTNVSPEEIGGKLTIGSSASNSNFLTGDVDSVSVSKMARSGDWLKALARSEGTNAPLVAYGADGQKEGGGQGSYFVTIANNLTADGWVVIIICITML